MRHDTRSGWQAAALTIAAFLSTAARGQGPEALERLRAISPSLPAVVVKVENRRVEEWVLGPQRQRDRRPVRASRIIEIGPTAYVEEAETGRWLVGHAPKEGSTVLECDQQFANLDALIAASAFAPLPRAPEGFTLREVARLPLSPTRLTSDGRGEVLYALCGNGDVWRIDVATGALKPVLQGDRYTDPDRGERMFVGMTLDRQGRLYLVGNQRVESARPIANEVTIYRTTATRDGDPADPQPWLRTSYPWGTGPYNHGVGHIAFGPDEFLYVNSGSRTDGNEPGVDPRYSQAGEHALTACLWRLDPRRERPEIEVYARGLRNAYGFCWDDRGALWATDNGPDADPPEELNRIERGQHYGFPYVFSDWTRKPYPHTPDPPLGQTFARPVVNVGPDGGARSGPLATFDPHSSPSGIVFLGNDFPPAYRGTFLVARFGNLLERPSVGFDVLRVRLLPRRLRLQEAQVDTILAPIARPVDLHLSGRGKVYICEYSRQVRYGLYGEMLPGRVLELAVEEGR